MAPRDKRRRRSVVASSPTTTTAATTTTTALGLRKTLAVIASLHLLSVMLAMSFYFTERRGGFDERGPPPNVVVGASPSRRRDRTEDADADAAKRLRDFLLSRWCELKREEERFGGGGSNPSSSSVVVPSRTIPNAFPRRRRRPVDSPYDGGITIVTHASSSKFRAVLFQIEQWNGPASVGIYLSGPDDVESFLAFVEEHSDALRDASFHVLMECHGNATAASPRESYPHNLLRNLALEHAPTDLIVAMDADFVTGHNCHSKLRNAIRSDDGTIRRLLNGRKTMFVLPAFEHTKSFRRKQQQIPLRESMPQTREEVLAMLNDGTLERFHLHQYPIGHNATDYESWIVRSSPSNTHYPIRYNVGYEPYVLVDRRGLPRYWPEFRGFGLNKWSWFVEAHYAGYDFEVLKDFFVVHLYHPPPLKKFPSKRNVQAMKRYKEYLVRTYGANPKDLVPSETPLPPRITSRNGR